MQRRPSTARDTAAIGVIGAGIGQCLQCRDAAGSIEGHCGGFGPGCFLPSARRAAAAPQPQPFTGFDTAALKSGEEKR
jgi:hypothetical protein